MAIKKIVVDRNVCIGASPCVFAAGTVFELDSENKAVMKLKDGTKTSASTEKSLLEDAAVADDVLMAAAQSCPVRAIVLIDDADKQVYP